MNEIKFYRVGDEFGNLSNFAKSTIFINNMSWKTVEHYFQALKFENYNIQDRIRDLSSPMLAAKEGRNRKNPLRADWESVKDDIMLTALRAKFKQNINLRMELLLTKDAILIEHTNNDSYWADGGDGTGKNMLGKLLMKVRNELLCENSDPKVILPPWLAFPTIDQYDMFWRMGIGESYICEWADYYDQLEDSLAYRILFPDPEVWLGFYDS